MSLCLCLPPGAMRLRFLLLLTLLGPGSSLQDGAEASPGPLLARGRRQVATDEGFNDAYDDYNTDAPETLDNNSTGAVSLSPELKAMMGKLGQRDSAGTGTPGPATVEVATGNSAGLDAGRTAIGNLSTELATQGIPVTLGPLTKELVTTIPPTMEAPSTELATTKALAKVPAATEALPMKSTVMEALSMAPAATEALTTEPAATEALTVKSTIMALSTGLVATEALTTQPVTTEALTLKSTIMEALSTEPAATEALSTGPAATKAPSTEPATTRSLTTALLMFSHPHRGTTVSASNSTDSFLIQGKKSQGVSPQTSVAPSPTGGLDYISVKQCLLAILILALVATIFLVCTVVLAVRLSRKSHMYPVRNYSPTEMVCISSLLPERSEGHTATANGSLPSKSHLLKEEPGEDREGDDLTLHSFLPA